ncbi:hypothetical protein [Okeania sp. SIO2B3]|uniref:hypothetical protein n=1 Tax=Okeania sp. SIO2B3 TaxID=2607784 RepID=UPI0013BF6B7F|nr:hypothetical protein [Okeania sp. SIO2B3]NET42300.1 hypothetical protein [Okeania sp. SIO2B3]
MFDIKRLKLLPVNALSFERNSNNYWAIDRSNINNRETEPTLSQHSNNYWTIVSIEHQ